jgi:hypothetical protein
MFTLMKVAQSWMKEENFSLKKSTCIYEYYMVVNLANGQIQRCGVGCNQDYDQANDV